MSRKKKEITADTAIDPEQQALSDLAKEIEKRKKAREAMLAGRYVEVDQETKDEQFKRLYEDERTWDKI